ncbi:MAG: hypothetical protein ACMUJM_05695 [bacterium]
MDGALRFISKKFSEMPTWVQVMTYIVLLCLYVYLYMAPRFLNGQVVAVTENGGIIPYRGVDLQTSIEGRLLKFKTNESGYWSIPVVARLPQSMRIQIYHEDDHAWHDVTIKASNVFLTKEFRLIVNNDPPGFKMERIAWQSDTRSRESLMTSNKDYMAGIAEAGELIIPEQIETTMKNEQLQKDIRQKVNDLVRSITKAGIDVNTSVPLSGRGAPTYIQRIQIIQAIEKDFNIKIPDEHWKALSSSDQLSDYIYKRKLLEHYDPKLYSIQQAEDWVNVQQQAPKDQRPIFDPVAGIL